MKRLKFNKTFTRKIKLGGDLYLVHQNKKEQSLKITRKSTGSEIYIYTQIGGLRYDKAHEQIIEEVFFLAHIDRYLVKI